MKLNKTRQKFPSLEVLLATVNGGKKAKFYLKCVREDSRGELHPFTKKGEKVYEDLKYILRGAAILTDTGKDEIEKIISLMDDVASLGFCEK